MQFSAHRKADRDTFMQAIVLMLFNDATSLKYTDIKEASGIEDTELRRTLQSLALGKSRVITKEPKVDLPLFIKPLGIFNSGAPVLARVCVPRHQSKCKGSAIEVEIKS